MHITLRQLRIFEAVARRLSFSRAAAELHLTQPAVSMQVKQLERQIGLPLLERIGKRLVLTEAGAELRRHANILAAHTLELKSAMDQLHGLQRGLLRLAVVSTANYFLPPVIAPYAKSHPGVRIKLQVANREVVLAALVENAAELAVISQPPDGDVLVAEPFMQNPLVAIAPPGHPLCAQRSISLARFAREALIMREPGSGTRLEIERHFAANGVDVIAGSEFSTNEAIKHAVQAGLGLSIVSAQTIELELETRRLVVLPVVGLPIMARWYLMHRRRKRLSAAAVAFRDLLFTRRRQ